jgi:hypothetical protein
MVRPAQTQDAGLRAANGLSRPPQQPLPLPPGHLGAQNMGSISVDVPPVDTAAAAAAAGGSDSRPLIPRPAASAAADAPLNHPDKDRASSGQAGHQQLGFWGKAWALLTAFKPVYWQVEGCRRCGYMTGAEGGPSSEGGMAASRPSIRYHASNTSVQRAGQSECTCSSSASSSRRILRLHQPRCAQAPRVLCLGYLQSIQCIHSIHAMISCKMWKVTTSCF